jgi:uncharacterized Zn-binding protein involved in type VI secretion
MPGLAKIGDTGSGVCPAHRSSKNYTTIIVVGQSPVIVNGVPTAVVGSVGVSTCGHPTVALVGSPNVFSTGAPEHRLGDTGTNPGPYVMLSGSPDVNGN